MVVICHKKSIYRELYTGNKKAQSKTFLSLIQNITQQTKSNMKIQVTTLTLVAVPLLSSSALGKAIVDGPRPTLAARQTNDNFGNQAIVDGTTLTTGLNNIGGQTYTYTEGYVIGPTITQGPSLQINPQVTQAFGCQIVQGGIQQGDCNNIQAKISSALATITNVGQNAATTATSSSSAQQTSSSSSSSSGNSNTNNGGTTTTSQSSSSTDAAVVAAPLQASVWMLTCAAAVGSVLVCFA